MGHNVLLVEIEQLQNVMVARAIGEGDDSASYRQLRTKLMANNGVKALLPKFVHTCRELGQFWGYIQPKFRHYRERKEFIWGEFRPVLDAVEKGLGAPVHEMATEALTKLDAEHVRGHWQKALNRIADDPEGPSRLLGRWLNPSAS